MDHTWICWDVPNEEIYGQYRNAVLGYSIPLTRFLLTYKRWRERRTRDCLFHRHRVSLEYYSDELQPDVLAVIVLNIFSNQKYLDRIIYRMPIRTILI
jgi:hypothetical protein